MSATDYFHEATICSLIAKAYENQGLVANAQYFKERTIFMLAKGLAALAANAMGNAGIK